MGYYMRFITTDAAPIDLVKLGKVLQNLNAKYALEIEDNEVTLLYGDDTCAAIEINLPGDGLFENEIEELIEPLEDLEGQQKKRVQSVLENAKQVFAVQVLSAARGSDGTLDCIGPIWKHLFEHHQGLLQADGEGYYDDAENLILEAD